MKVLAKTVFCFSFFFVGNCTIENSFVTEHKDGWFNDSNSHLFYCRANIKNEESADPICFEAAFQKYEVENFSNAIKTQK